MHDALFALGWLSVAEAEQQPGWNEHLGALAQNRRATQLAHPAQSAGPIWIVAERLNQFDRILPGARRSPPITAPDAAEPAGSDATAALVEIIRGRMAAVGPALATQLAEALGVTRVDIELALLALEREGFVMRGQFSRALPAGEQWCERHLLARVLWTRQRSYSATAAGGASGPVRNTPIVLLQRKNLSLWQSLREVQGEPYQPTSRAQRVVQALTDQGAMFFDELSDASHLLAAELEVALGELVAVGLVHCDSYAGLRALVMPAARRARQSARRARGVAQPWSGLHSAGRWALLRRPAAEAAPAAPDPEKIEQLVRILLRRHGVLCFQLLQREAGWLPPWRVLVRACQRLEARGELRGGRFIAGLTGEQFALPEVIAQLRSMRGSAPTGLELCLSAADPLNLIGTLLPGTRIGGLAGSRVLYRDGLPIAALVWGEVQTLITMTPGEQWHARTRLLRTGSLQSEAQAHFGPAMTHRLG